MSNYLVSQDGGVTFVDPDTLAIPLGTVLTVQIKTAFVPGYYLRITGAGPHQPIVYLATPPPDPAAWTAVSVTVQPGPITQNQTGNAQ